MVNAEFVPMVKRCDVGIHQAITDAIVGKFVIVV
jgi:hypothetical protein